MKQVQAKHKICRRIGYCIWNSPKCPSVKRPYAAGLQGKNAKKKKLSTYGEMMQEKQKLKAHYALTETQLRNTFLKPTIFAAKQMVVHRHVKVDGKIVDRPSYLLKAGQVISIDPAKSPALAEAAKAVNSTIPPYFESDKEQLKLTVVREPMLEEIPVQVEALRVVEYYAR